MVVVEIELALGSGRPVVPCWSTTPTCRRGELPEVIRPLAFRNGRPLPSRSMPTST